MFVHIFSRATPLSPAMDLGGFMRLFFRPISLAVAAAVFLAAGTTAGSSSLAISSTTAPRPLPASQAWAWPLAGKPVVAHAFAPPPKPWLSGHRGVDLAAAQGTPVLAPDEGVISFVGVVVDRSVITITTAQGLRVSFEPVVSSLKKGTSVARGDVLGVLRGPTHCGTTPPAGEIGSAIHSENFRRVGRVSASLVSGIPVSRQGELDVRVTEETTLKAADSCLHWGVRRGEEYIDPLQFVVDLRPSVLLPLLPRERTVVAHSGAQHQPLLYVRESDGGS